jgi:hypothetical protein
MIYSMMFGPQRKAPCPSCTSFLTSWNGTATNLRERVAIAVTARSPIARLVEYKRQRGFDKLPFASDVSGYYTRTYVNADDADVPGFSVFTRRDGTIRHFYSGEMSGAMADPGQDPRGAPDLDPLWLMLDITPEGRGTDWYPKLEYANRWVAGSEWSDSLYRCHLKRLITNFSAIFIDVPLGTCWNRYPQRRGEEVCRLTGMRGDERTQDGMFSYVSLEQRVPADHPLRAVRKLTDAVLGTLSPEFDALYAASGRPSIAPEYILRALLL